MGLKAHCGPPAAGGPDQPDLKIFPRTQRKKLEMHPDFYHIRPIVDQFWVFQPQADI